MDSGEWMVVGVIVTLFSLYNIILGIKDKNSKPIKELEKNFASLDKTVTILATTMESLNDSIKDLMESNGRKYARFSSEIKDCADKIADHETRISVIEKSNSDRE